MQTESHPLSIDRFKRFSNNRLDEARAFAALKFAQQRSRLSPQAESDQHRFRASHLATSSFSCAAVRHSLCAFSRPKHPTMKSILSERLILSNCSSVISPDGSTYSCQRPKLSEISEYVGEFIRSVLDVIKGFLNRHTKNLGYLSIGLAAGVKRTMLFLFGVNGNVFDASGPSFSRSAFYCEFVHT